MGNVTIIPATKNKFTSMPVSAFTRRKAAGYARVSTDRDEQFTSYEAQVDYYTNLIKSHSDWEFVKVYTDEGISGTSTKKREGFKEMIADALDGKIDLIVTKSISRFARNTVDTLTHVRNLKEHGVEVYFEKENIWTFDSKGEVLITIMSSLAQEESRSISENVTWGVRKRFADGKVSVGYKHFLGYEKGPNGELVVNQEEAKVVRFIYQLFLDGKTPAGICKELERHNILTPSGKEEWHASTVWSILQNEKYKGDALLQKTFMVDFLSKKTKVNEGEVPQYYVNNSHEAIIKRDEWELVQYEITRRKSIGRSYSGTSAFSSKIVCGDCNGYYGNKTWHSNSKYRKVIWQCNAKYKGKVKCNTPHLDEELIKTKFLEAYNTLMGNRETVVADCEKMRTRLSNVADLNLEIDSLNTEITVVVEMVKSGIKENAHSTLSQENYQRNYEELVARYDKLKSRLDALTSERKRKLDRDHELSLFIDGVKNHPLVLEEWDARLWILLLDHAKVTSKGKIEFVFKNGSVITVEI